jgi:IclR family acetate operon transcriptional repressor
LRVVASRSSGLSLAEIATTLQLPKTSVLNLLRSLQFDDYISAASGKYTLGSESLSLAGAISGTVSFPSSLLPKLRQLCKATNETVTLGTHTDDGLSVTYLEVLESSHDLRLSHKRGHVEPIHASSIGQALLAFMPRRLLDNLLAQRELGKLTKNTIAKGELREKIPQIRRDGAAKSIGGQADGTMGVGAPVFEASGVLRCAIAAGGPIGRVKPKVKEIRALVTKTAEDMSRILGYQGPYPPSQVEADVLAPAGRNRRRGSPL